MAREDGSGPQGFSGERGLEGPGEMSEFEDEDCFGAMDLDGNELKGSETIERHEMGPFNMRSSGSKDKPSKHPNYGLRKPLLVNNKHSFRVKQTPVELNSARTLNRVSDIGKINLFGHSTVAAERFDDVFAVADVNTVVLANMPTPIGKVLADNKISEFVNHANTSKYVSLHCNMNEVEGAKAALTKRLVGDTQTFSIRQSKAAGITGEAYGQYVIGNKGTRPKKDVVMKGKGKVKGRGRGGKG
jgi:hypothetical protein